MKPLVIALAFFAGSAFAGDGCQSYGSQDAKAPVQDKSLLAQATAKPMASQAVVQNAGLKAELKAEPKAAAQTVVRAAAETPKSGAL